MGERKGMKRKALALTTIFALLISVVTISSFVRIGEANWLTPTDQKPPDAPILTIQWPVCNETPNTSDIDLNFIICVEGWNAYYSPNLSRIGYSLDEKPYAWFDGSYAILQTFNNGLTNFHFSMKLKGLTDGNHSLTVSAQYIGKYSPAPYELRNFNIIGYSQEIYFSVDTPFYVNPNNIDNYPIVKENLIPEFPSWTSLVIVSLAVTIIGVIYKQKLHNLNHEE